MTTIVPFATLNIFSPESLRAKLFLEYEEELGRLQEYVDMYRKSSKSRLIPQDSIDFVTTVLDQSEALLGLNRSLTPLEPAFTSVYTKTTSSGNPRPTLTAYDLKKFHGFRNQVTDLVVLEGIRDVHAVLLHFAEHESAEAFAHAAFGLEFGAPYIQTTEMIKGREFYVINFLFNDESMKLNTVRETYTFINRFLEAYPELPHMKVVLTDRNLCKIYLDSTLILKTAEAYKNGRPLPSRASSGFSLLGNFAFHQEGWNELPEQFRTDDQIIATLEHMQLDMIPTYNRLLKEGLEVLQDDRSFLPQTEIEYVRERLETIIWDEVMTYFSRSMSGFEKIYALIQSQKPITEETVKTVIQAKDSIDNSRSQLVQLRTQFGKIVPRLSGLRSISLGTEFTQATKELERAYSMVSTEDNRSIKFIQEIDGFGAKATLSTLPRIVGFYGFLKLLITIASQRAFRKNRDRKTNYLHIRFMPTILRNEGHVNVTIYAKGIEADPDLIQALNDPFRATLPSKSSFDFALKQIQDIVAHVYKISLTERGAQTAEGVDRLQELFHVGNLSNRTDDLREHSGFYIEINFPAFGRVEEFRRKS